MKKRVAVFVSGRGSNLAALIGAAAAPSYPAEISLVISNRPEATAIAIAEEAGVPVCVIDHKQFGKDRRAFEEEIQRVLVEHGIELVCLAGFMRLLTSWFVSKWRDKILNIHPALLPAFKGLHTHERALQAKARLHGATVHFVVPEMDSGPILMRIPIRIRPNDTPETLSKRVLRIEHRIYPAALKLVAEGRVKNVRGRCLVDGSRINDRVLFVINNRRRAVLSGPNARKLKRATRQRIAA